MEKYPATLNIDYSEKSDRLTVFFRFFLAIPILIILALLTTSSYESEQKKLNVFIQLVYYFYQPCL